MRMTLNAVLPQSPKSWEHATPSFLALNDPLPSVCRWWSCAFWISFWEMSWPLGFYHTVFLTAGGEKHINLSQKLLICQTIFFSAFPFFNVFFTSLLLFLFLFWDRVLKLRLPASVSLELGLRACAVSPGFNCTRPAGVRQMNTCGQTVERFHHLGSSLCLAFFSVVLRLKSTALHTQ